ncbi:MAG TPA: glycine cleavage system aminomethyltransferase GcvT [Bacillota bacterium]
MHELKRTPLFPLYQRYNARVVDFAGWAMPVQFSGIVEEHRAVRERAGLFDVSHMGEIEVWGPGALAALQQVVTNDLARLTPGRAAYTLMCRDDGGIVDDLLVYCLAPDRFLLVPNAANIDKDFEHVRRQVGSTAAGLGGVEVANRSDDYALLALQGPRAQAILARVLEGPAAEPSDPSSPLGLRPFRFVAGAPLAGRRARIISRTGYTGEDGFEIYLAPEDAETIWEALLGAGEGEGLVPAGLGARDTLRFEACLPLYGNELTEQTNPLEAGLGRFVKLDKGPFTGREALQRVAETGPTRRLVGLELIGRGIARPGYTVTDGRGNAIGHVTSGTHAPTLGRSLALAYVPVSAAADGTELAVVVRDVERAARVIPIPFYRRG